MLISHGGPVLWSLGSVALCFSFLSISSFCFPLFVISILFVPTRPLAYIFTITHFNQVPLSRVWIMNTCSVLKLSKVCNMNIWWLNSHTQESLQCGAPGVVAGRQRSIMPYEKQMNLCGQPCLVWTCAVVLSCNQKSMEVILSRWCYKLHCKQWLAFGCLWTSCFQTWSNSQN